MPARFKAPRSPPNTVGVRSTTSRFWNAGAGAEAAIRLRGVTHAPEVADTPATTGSDTRPYSKLTPRRSGERVFQNWCPKPMCGESTTS